MAFEDKSLRGGNSGEDIYNEIVLHQNKYNNVSYFKKEIEKTLQLSVAAFHLQRHKPRQT